MTPIFRLLLLVAAAATLVFMLRGVRKSRLHVEDTVFWLLFAVVLVVLAIFPDITFWAAQLLGIQSPVNLLYLIVIGILTLRMFQMALHIARLESKLTALTQAVALENAEREKK